MIKKTIITFLKKIKNCPIASAHCDGPCGVYDPAQARVSAEAVLSLTKKILAITPPSESFVRFLGIKEEQAEETKRHVLILWTDFFKPEHLEEYPNLHNLIWETAKNCSSCKQETSLEHAEKLLDQIKQIHEIFWKIKGKDVPWITAS